MSQAPEGKTAIQDINQFASLVANWHQAKMGALKHLLEVPEGTTFTVGEDKVVLEGAVLAGFKFGVELAIMQFSYLPFVAEIEDVSEH